MLADGLKMRVEPVEIWKDCGKPDALLETNRYLLDHGRDNTETAQQRPDALIIPPVYIDPSAEIRRSVIGPHVSVGPECQIEDSVIRDSILEARASVTQSLLDASLVGVDARVAGSFRAVNLGDNSVTGSG